MKNLKSLLLVIFAITVLFSCKNEANESKEVVPTETTTDMYFCP